MIICGNRGAQKKNRDPSRFATSDHLAGPSFHRQVRADRIRTSCRSRRQTSSSSVSPPWLPYIHSDPMGVCLRQLYTSWSVNVHPGGYPDQGDSLLFSNLRPFLVLVLHCDSVSRSDSGFKAAGNLVNAKLDVADTFPEL
jgi:hypothetical protein